AHRREAAGGVHAGERDLLYLEGDDVAAASEARGLAGVVPRGLDALVDDEARGAARVGVEHVDAVAHGARGHRGQAAELASSEDADGRAGKQSGRLAHALLSVSSRVCASTSSRRALRQVMSFFARAASVVARICTASRPALAAPAAPMASVATGIPFGI